MSNGMIFLAVDGDSAGQLVGRAVLANDVETLHEVSNRINHGQDIIGDWAKANGGMLISAGGDEGNVGVPPEALHNVEQLRSDYQYGTQLTLTVGVGNNLSEAGKALMVGKLRGKNQVCQYDASVEAEYAQAEKAANEGTATGEGKKLGDAYMKQATSAPAPMQESEQAPAQDTHADCAYCAELAGDSAQDPDHCSYCHDEPEAPHCEYCAMADQAAAHDPMADGHGDDCEYCRAAHDPSAADHAADCIYCQQAEAAPSHDHTGDDCAYCADSAAAPAPGAEVPGAAPVLPNGQQEMTDIAQEIEATTAPGETPQDVLATMDGEQNGPGDMPGTEMQDGTSHPANYGDAAPTSMGMAEDEVPEQGPSLGDVLASGIDNHAQQIQREKVVALVSEALEGFKACKPIFERAEQQAPQLHSSSLAMLKAMIEMAKMLGLAPKQEATPQEAQNPQQNQAPAQGSPQSPQSSPQAAQAAGGAPGK